jgi:hypothetical protein
LSIVSDRTKGYCLAFGKIGYRCYRVLSIAEGDYSATMGTGFKQLAEENVPLILKRNRSELIGLEPSVFVIDTLSDNYVTKLNPQGITQARVIVTRGILKLGQELEIIAQERRTARISGTIEKIEVYGTSLRETLPGEVATVSPLFVPIAIGRRSTLTFSDR